MRRIRTALLALLLLPACDGSKERDSAEFGPEQARALIPAASGISADGARVIAALGAAVTWHDMEATGSTPLTAILLALGPLPYESSFAAMSAGRSWTYAARFVLLSIRAARCGRAS